MQFEVLIPSFNHAQYLESAVDSVVTASRKAGVATAITIVDDGSTDDSVELIRELSTRYRFVSARFQENRGAAKTISAAIENSSADWICILNSDDMYLEDYFGHMASELSDGPPDFIISRCIVESAGARVQQQTIYRRPTLYWTWWARRAR